MEVSIPDLSQVHFNNLVDIYTQALANKDLASFATALRAHATSGLDADFGGHTNAEHLQTFASKAALDVPSSVQSAVSEYLSGRMPTTGPIRSKAWDQHLKASE